MSILNQRASRGANYLDKTIPGWFRKINLKRLDISSNNCCVMGQLFGSFNACARNGLMSKAVDLGMHCLAGAHRKQKNFDKLTQAWKREIEARLAA